MYESCRIYNISLFPFCRDVSFYPLSYCNYDFYTLYMPMWSLYAFFPPPRAFLHIYIVERALHYLHFLSTKKRAQISFHRPTITHTRCTVNNFLSNTRWNHSYQIQGEIITKILIRNIIKIRHYFHNFLARSFFLW